MIASPRLTCGARCRRARDPELRPPGLAGHPECPQGTAVGRGGGSVGGGPSLRDGSLGRKQTGPRGQLLAPVPELQGVTRKPQLQRTGWHGVLGGQQVWVQQDKGEMLHGGAPALNSEGSLEGTGSRGGEGRGYCRGCVHRGTWTPWNWDRVPNGKGVESRAAPVVPRRVTVRTLECHEPGGASPGMLGPLFPPENGVIISGKGVVQRPTLFRAMQ